MSGILTDLKLNAKKNIDSSDLYSLQDASEKLGVAQNTFKKYFLSDLRWSSNACMKKGRVKYFRGDLIISKAMELADEEYANNFYRSMDEAMEEVDKIFNSVDAYLDDPSPIYSIMSPVKSLVDKEKLIDTFKTIRKNELEKVVSYKDPLYWKGKLEEKQG